MVDHEVWRETPLRHACQLRRMRVGISSRVMELKRHRLFSPCVRGEDVAAPLD